MVAKKLKRAKAKKATKSSYDAVKHKYTDTQITDILWAAFSKGTRLPLAKGAFAHAKARYRNVIKANNGSGVFDNTLMLANTKICARTAGEIATSLARFKAHGTISRTEFDEAANLLHAIVSGGAGGLC